MPAGNIADLSMAVQLTKGTPAVPAATTMSRVYLAGGGLTAVKETADLEETSSGRLRSESFVTQIRADGSPEFFARPVMLGWLLWGAMGAKALAGAADPWTHTFTLANTQPYMTFWRMLGGGLFERFTDCKLGSLKFHSEAGRPLRVTATVLGLQPASQTAAQVTATVEVTDTFMHADAKSLLIFEGSPVASIGTVDLTINTGVQISQGDDVVGFQVVEGMQSVELQVEQTITDFATYNRMIYGAASPSNNAAPSPNVIELSGAAIIDIGYAKRDSAGAIRTPERSLHFTADRLAMASAPVPDADPGGDPIAQTVTYKVYQPSAGGSGLTAILKNGKNAYAAS